MTISSCKVTTYVQPIDQSYDKNEILDWLICFDCIRLIVCVGAQTLWRWIIETRSVKYTWPVSPCRRHVQIHFQGRNACNLSNINDEDQRTFCPHNRRLCVHYLQTCKIVHIGQILKMQIRLLCVIGETCSQEDIISINSTINNVNNLTTASMLFDNATSR